MPSQTDEEAHQLSYLQKHLANILSLLAEPVEGHGEESLVCKTAAFFTTEFSGGFASFFSFPVI